MPNLISVGQTVHAYVQTAVRM